MVSSLVMRSLSSTLREASTTTFPVWLCVSSIFLCRVCSQEILSTTSLRIRCSSLYAATCKLSDMSVQ